MNKMLQFLSGYFSEKNSQNNREIQIPNIGWKECAEKISDALKFRQPLLVSRLGWLEAHFIGHFEQHGRLSQELKKKLWDTPGIFPVTEKQIKEFHVEFTSSLKEVDMLGVMKCPYESYIIKKYVPDISFGELTDLEPYYYPIPWTQHLEGKKVLVIHPFAKSIHNQYYLNRKNIFQNKKVLPEFSLRTIIPPQTLCGNTNGFTSWSEALQALKDQVSTQEFDVAIIGCGSYGLPMGAYIKKMGKVSVHLGGATQILFGIRGGRWDSMPIFKHMMNKSWVRPLLEERPPNWQNAEMGCYW